MEYLNLKYESTKKAINTIGLVLQKIEENKKYPQEWEDILNDSLVKRFEYSIDSLWKYLKLYLEVYHGKEQNSPKLVFKECLRVRILTEEETLVCLEMVDDRNKTSHMYKHEIAQELITAIPKYYPTMCLILEKARPN